MTASIPIGSGVTEVTIPTIAYEDGPECPICGRPRVWRIVDLPGFTRQEWGTGQDCGRRTSGDEPCWTCRPEDDR